MQLARLIRRLFVQPAPLPEPNKDEAKARQKLEAKLQRRRDKLIAEKTRFWQETAWADRHLASAGERPRGVSTPILNRVLGLIPPGSKVIDVGCGHGRYSIPFAEAGHSVVATDVSARMLELLNEKKGGLPIETRQGDAHHLPAQDGEFDVIFSNDFMGHFPDWAVLLQEQSRICRPGGRVIFSLSCREHRERCAEAGGQEFTHEYSPDPLSERPFWAETTLPELEQAASAAGLEIAGLFPLKFFTDSHLFGRALGTERYQELKKELRQKIAASQEAADFYNWLELNYLQHLPYHASNLTLILMTKPG